MNPNLRTASLPRANPQDVQAIVDFWKQKNPGKSKGELREWLYLTVNHWFPTPVDSNAASGTIKIRGPFQSGCWCTEDVEKCRAALST